MWREVAPGVREVAVKMILAGELAGKESLRMFQREAHAAAGLHHPNIVPVFEIGEHETQHYFTMRFVPGRQTVADWAAPRRGDFRALALAAAQVAASFLWLRVFRMGPVEWGWRAVTYLRIPPLRRGAGP